MQDARAFFYARVFLRKGRFPSEVRELTRGEQMFLVAALAVEDEEDNKTANSSTQAKVKNAAAAIQRIRQARGG